MSSFAELPEELWEMIVFPLEKGDVSAISRCCKRLRERAVPSLYNSLEWTWNSVPRYGKLSSPPVHLLLRSLVENRQMGAYVKYLNFSTSCRLSSKRSPGSLWEQGEQPKCTVDELRVLKDYVHELELPSKTLWTTALETGNINVFIALVLSQLTNLRTLHLSTECHVDTPFLGLLFRRALISSAPCAGFSTFSHLQRVEFPPIRWHAMPAYATVSEEQVTSLFYLPAIQTIDAVLYPERSNFSWPGDERPHASTLTTLKLPCCAVDQTALLHLLSAAPKLRTLVYDYVADMHPPSELCDNLHFDLAQLSQALRQVRTTLTHLSLSIKFFIGDGPTETGPRGIHWGIKNRFGGLHEFGNLKSLSIPFVVLFGLSETPRSVDRLDGLLPRSIQHLCLTDDSVPWGAYRWPARACLERLGDYLVDRKCTVPELERLDLDLLVSHAHEWDEDEQEELREMCEEAGVQCEVYKEDF